MLMRVTVHKRPRESVVVPEAALSSRGQTHSVFVVDADGRAQAREIEIGARTPGLVEVVAGLESGERVVTDGIQNVRPGQPVRVVAFDDGTRSLGELLSGTVAP